MSSRSDKIPPAIWAALIAGALALWIGRFIATQTSVAGGYFILLPLLVALSIPLLIFGWEDREPLHSAIRIFVLALLVRLFLTTFLDALVNPNTLAPDQVRYHLAGTYQAELWHGTREELPIWFMNPGNPYYYLVGWLYYVFGANMLLPKLFNSVVGALAVVGLYRITLRLATRRAALLAGVFAAFFPSLMLWGTLAIRDSLVVLGLVLCFDAVLDWSVRKRPSALVVLGLGIFTVIALRGYLASLLLASVALSAMTGWGRSVSLRRFLVSVSVLVLLTIVLRQAGITGVLVEQVSLQELESMRQNLAVGGSAYGHESDISSLGGALLHLPTGIAYFLLAPFPWSVRSSLQLIALPEVFLWYCLVPFVIWGVRLSIQQNGARLAPMLTFLAGVTVTYSLVEGNVGTAYRHRAQVLIFFLSFAAVGLDAFLTRREQQRRRLTQPGLAQREGALGTQ